MTRMEKSGAAQAASEAGRTDDEQDASSSARLQLNDRQLVVLSAAARRDDRLIAVPEALKGRARDIFGQALMRHGLASETVVTGDQPVWRQDETGCVIGLVATSAALTALGIDDEPAEEQVLAGDAKQPATAAIPRAGSKQAQLVAMLSTEDGCSLEEAAHALGWLPHTTRAALTGLRQKGHVIERLKAENGRGSRHRIVAASPAAAMA